MIVRRDTDEKLLLAGSNQDAACGWLARGKRRRKSPPIQASNKAGASYREIPVQEHPTKNSGQHRKAVGIKIQIIPTAPSGDNHIRRYNP